VKLSRLRQAMDRDRGGTIAGDTQNVGRRRRGHHRPRRTDGSITYRGPWRTARPVAGRTRGVFRRSRSGDSVPVRRKARRRARRRSPLGINLLRSPSPCRDGSWSFRKQAEVRRIATDRYGRTVARVRCEGIDANAEQVRAGMAWAFTRYLRDPGIAALEVSARERRVGLWADASPVAPWEWRIRRRGASAAHGGP
jgi:hypothetical protein